MVKLVYTKEKDERSIHELTETAWGIRAICRAMGSYAMESFERLDQAPSKEVQDDFISIWPLLEILIEPIADYLFDYIPPTKPEGRNENA
jgi:hypothetical protein